MRDLFVQVLNRKSLRNIHKWKVRNCVKLAHLTHKSLVWIWAVYLSYKGRRNDVSVIQQAAERDAKEPDSDWPWFEKKIFEARTWQILDTRKASREI